MTGRLATILVAIPLLAIPAAPARADSCREVTWSSIGEDAGELVKAPFHMDEDAALKTTAALAGIGASMIWLDAPLDHLVVTNAPAWQPAHRLASLTSWYGRSGGHAALVTAGIVGTVAAAGWLADEDRMVDTAAIMGEAVVFATVITYAGKTVFGRRRPYNDEGPHRFRWFVAPGNEPSVSFPSGHSATAFALAGAGAGRHPHWYVQIPAYLLATSAGLQRMDTRMHWASDVLAGGLLGYAVSAFLVDRYACDTGGGEEPPALSLSFGISF